MRRSLAILFLFLATSAFADWSGAKYWAELSDGQGGKVAEAGQFKQGYFTALSGIGILVGQDKRTFGLLNTQIDALQLSHEVSTLYADPTNEYVDPDSAMKICLERLISRTADGPRLLNLIYANVGGWKPYTTWSAYKADLQALAR